MLSDEERQTIDYLKVRLYGNEGCKFIDVAQSDLRIFLNLVENQQKDIESWKKYCDEQQNDITLKNNKICDLEFKIEKQSKEIEELKEDNKKKSIVIIEYQDLYEKLQDKIKAKIEELNKDFKEYENGQEWEIQDEIRGQIDVLHSLLEKE